MYFITNGECVRFWAFVGDLLEPLGYGRPHIALPALLIYCVAWLWQYVIIPLVSANANDLAPGTCHAGWCNNMLAVHPAKW